MVYGIEIGGAENRTPAISDGQVVGVERESNAGGVEMEGQLYSENSGLPQGGNLRWHFWNEVEKAGVCFSDLPRSP